jgi:protein-S-isoprenylcysteine O-methyltransferase Ste14
MAIILLTLATLLGGGSLVLFGAFLFFGPLNLVPMGWTEPWALAWDGFISLVFFAQHSTMLRRGFRDRLGRHLPSCYHGALYAVASGLALAVVVVFWQSCPTTVLVIEGFSRFLMRALFLLASAGMAWGGYALGAFDPLGLEAIRAHARGMQSPPPELVIRGPYRWVRHPLYSFSIAMIWACPDISTDRLLFNVLWTAWIYGATFLEEADLAAMFGEPYRDYQRRVPRLIPCKLPGADDPQHRG